jgi:hypothetical protein
MFQKAKQKIFISFCGNVNILKTVQFPHWGQQKNKPGD